MEFDPFGLFVKDLAIRNVITRCTSSGLLYTTSLPLMRAPQASTYYTLTVVAASMLLWQRRLGHPGPDALLKLSTASAITCNKP
jgi:hypothetical protein